MLYNRHTSRFMNARWLVSTAGTCRRCGGAIHRSLVDERREGNYWHATQRSARCTVKRMNELIPTQVCGDS